MQIWMTIENNKNKVVFEILLWVLQSQGGEESIKKYL